eukprot:scaffold843_cov330-Pavlova_lutheri.AAC.28
METDGPPRGRDSSAGDAKCGGRGREELRTKGWNGRDVPRGGAQGRQDPPDPGPKDLDRIPSTSRWRRRKISIGVKEVSMGARGGKGRVAGGGLHREGLAAVLERHTRVQEAPRFRIVETNVETWRLLDGTRGQAGNGTGGGKGSTRRIRWFDYNLHATLRTTKSTREKVSAGKERRRRTSDVP